MLSDPQSPSATRTDTSDAELMRRVQADDGDAFGVLYDRLAASALRVAEAQCRDRGRAEDAVQEAFWAAWRIRGAFDPRRGSVRSWIFAIVRHRAIDSTRLNRRHDDAREPRDEVIEGVPSRADSLESDAVRREQAQALHGWMARLPDAQLEVVALAYFGELSHREIAAELAVPLGTVKARMRLGMERLRMQLSA